MFQLTRPSSTSSTRCSLPEVCTLLEAHGRDLNATLWEGEMAQLLEWAKTTMLEHGVDGHTQRRMRAVTLSLGSSQEQESLSEANYENSFCSPKLPSSEEGLDENNYSSHRLAHEIGVNSSFQSAKTMELKLFAMLDQLEAGDFDHISDQIIEWVNKTSGWEGDGQALM
ncbi:eukaryotic translation initiation factor 4G, putative [Rhizoctonia solani AG-3 Rhs1AP]|uniref:Eukaryotic translation initiation factor 4G, putative n=1 Tax=Rhizoctonia solani AG-3 Rhs1AP TaxID=1086054 RepID=X8J881_9AGAM|nr:eukaryotic translation initiation factor 4G, putative [Rhizoctonia solani AG-3 Rhs1AP]